MCGCLPRLAMTAEICADEPGRTRTTVVRNAAWSLQVCEMVEVSWLACGRTIRTQPRRGVVDRAPYGSPTTQATRRPHAPAAEAAPAEAPRRRARSRSRGGESSRDRSRRPRLGDPRPATGAPGGERDRGPGPDPLRGRSDRTDAGSREFAIRLTGMSVSAIGPCSTSVANALALRKVLARRRLKLKKA